MTAEVIGEAKVLITADFSTFDDELRAKLTNAARKAGNDAEKILKRSGDKSGREFADGISKAAGSQKTLDSIRGSVERLETAARRAGNTQADAAAKVRVAEAALAKVKEKSAGDSERIIRAEERLAKARRDAADADVLARTATRALFAARDKLAVASTRQGEDAGKAFAQGLERAVTKGSGKAGDDSGNFFSRAFRTAAAKSIGQNLFRGLLVSAGGLLTALSPLSTLLGGATAAIVALGAALATASGSAISLGGVLGSLGLAAVAVKVGFSGLGDALKEQTKAQAELASTGKVSKATQEKLDAALKNLAPSARAVVKELGAMTPAWQAVRRVVQQDLFAGIAHSLQQLGNTFFPILTRQLGTAAANLNLFARGLTDFITRGNRANQVNTILSGLNGILKTLLQAIGPLVGGFLDIFTASLPFAQQLATVIRNIGVDFGLWLGRVADGQGFQQFMQTAMTLAGNLFQLLGNIGSIIGSVFAAGTATGGNLLTTLRNITGQFALFLQSAAGQQALASFFGLIAQSGQVLVGVFRTLSPLLSGIGALFSALQPALQALGAALTPVIAQLSLTLGAVLAQLGPVLAQLVVAIAPIAAMLGTALVSALQVLLPAVVQLVAALTPLVTTILGIAVTLITQLLNALLPLVPVIVQVATALATGLQTTLQMLVPVLAQSGANTIALVQALLPLLPGLVQLIPPAFQLVQALLQMVIALQPLTTAILASFIQLIVQLTPAFLAVIPYIAGFTSATAGMVAILARVIAKVVEFAVVVVTKFAAARTFAISAAASLIAGVVGFFAGLPGRINGFMVAFASVILHKIDQAVQYFRTLPGRIVGALAGIGSALVASGQNAVQGLINGIKSKAGEVLSAAQDLANKVKSGIGGALKIFSPSRVTYAQGQFAGQGLINGLLNKVRAVGRAATDLANAVPSAIGKALTKLDSSLVGLSNSLPAGAKRRIDAVVAAGKSQFDALAKSSAALDVKLKAGQAKLQDLLQKSQQLAQSVAQSVLQSGDITKGQDTSFRGIITGLQTAVTNARQFTKVIAALQKSGLNSTSLQQIIGAGPDAGTAIGQSLLNAGRAGINQVNKLQTQLQAAANQAAKTASNAIFGQGITLARGLVAGLASQKASLDKQMERLADVLVIRVLKLLQSLKLPGVNTLKIPGLKDGGVVQGQGAAGTLIRAGEYGRKEAVIPLTKPKRARELMDSTGLSALVAAGNSSKSKTIEVPVHVHGNVVDFDALTAHIESVFQRYGFRPRLGIVTAGGKL